MREQVIYHVPHYIDEQSQLSYALPAIISFRVHLHKTPSITHTFIPNGYIHKESVLEL